MVMKLNIAFTDLAQLTLWDFQTFSNNFFQGNRHSQHESIACS